MNAGTEVCEGKEWAGANGFFLFFPFCWSFIFIPMSVLLEITTRKNQRKEKYSSIIIFKLLKAFFFTGMKFIIIIII